jgi:hypothetical protein
VEEGFSGWTTGLVPQDEAAGGDIRLSEEASADEISSSVDDISDRDPYGRQ